jgi:hypothetical protein
MVLFAVFFWGMLPLARSGSVFGGWRDAREGKPMMYITEAADG